MCRSLKLLFLCLVAVVSTSILSVASYTVPPVGSRPDANMSPSSPVMSVPRAKPKGFRWKWALLESFNFLALEQGDRVMQKGTRKVMGGPFFTDWGKSVKNVHGWGDGDPFITNYIAHPMQGAVSGFIQIRNDPRGRDVQFGRSKQYWYSRLRALAWSAGYSVQFEIGPISEATIGHVGLISGTAGFVDFVMTPLGGFGMMILEDVLNRYILKRLVAGTDNPFKLTLYRTFFNPSRTMATAMAGRFPWDPQRPKLRRTAEWQLPFHNKAKDHPKKVEGWNQLAWPGASPSGLPLREPKLLSSVDLRSRPGDGGVWVLTTPDQSVPGGFLVVDPEASETSALVQ
jgi:hypothetical protein